MNKFNLAIDAINLQGGGLVHLSNILNYENCKNINKIYVYTNQNLFLNKKKKKLF